ncbi:GGDEF domain-containing protein [Massilia sp. S19_KUP03_FR1]|uniref:GGDEF domain-containing protein n=1 Tax=Massilia sp. S19_KUP03_FR1 TaxID=3025503 RepID=UPI002FCD6F5D
MLIIGIGNLSFAALMGAYARDPVAQPALRMWMWARVLLGACQVASWANLSLDFGPLTQVIALCWVAGMAMEMAAYCQFFGYANWRRLLYPATALCMVAVAAALLRGLSIPQTTVVISIAVGLFAGVMGVILLWPRGGTPPLQRAIGLTDAALALAILFWVWPGARPDGAEAAGGPLTQSLALLTGYVLMIVKGFGFLLLCKQEDDRKMLHLATVDSLTGLLNRHAFFDQATALRMRAAGAARMALLMLDLDHFKRINDRYGHATGDEALRMFAHTVRTTLAGRYIVGRLGGEEFALALAGPLDEALHVAEQLRAAVSALLLPTSDGPCAVTVSIGVAALHANETLTTGLARADLALYDAKRGGRDRVCRAVVERVEIEPVHPPHSRQQFFA